MTSTNGADILPAMQTRTGVPLWTPDGTRIVARDTEDVPSVTRDVPRDIAPDTGDVPRDTEDVPRDTEDVPSVTRDVPRDIAPDTGDVPRDTEDVPRDTEDVPRDTEDVTGATPDVLRNVPRDTQDVPRPKKRKADRKAMSISTLDTNGRDVAGDTAETDGVLAGMSQAAAIRYACETVRPLSNAAVHEWLAEHGMRVDPAYVRRIVSPYRREHALSDTADLPVMTPESLDAWTAKLAPAPEAPAAPDTDAQLIPEPPVSVEPVAASPATPAPETTMTERPAPAAAAPVAPQQPEKPLVVWPVLLMALSAFVAIWSGWVGMGEMTGFGVVRLFPGISDFEINTAITLPIGVEAYASYALYVWLSGRARTTETYKFAKWSAFGALALGAAGQIAYHLLTQAQADELSQRQAVADAAAKAAGRTAATVHAIAPWWITTFVACLPVVVVGMGAALAHMVRRERVSE